MKIRTIKWVAMIFVVLIQTSCASHDKSASTSVALHCPTMFVNSYTVPGPAVAYICCAPNDIPDQAKAIFADNEPVTINQNSGQSDTSLTVLSSSESSCVRKDSLSPIERSTLSVMSACSSFVTHEQIECTCKSQCSTPCFKLSCDCPGVPEGELPVVSQTQDSIGSQAIFKGKVTTPCSELPTDVDG